MDYGFDLGELFGAIAAASAKRQRASGVPRHLAKCRRLRTIIQDLMMLTAVMASHARSAFSRLRCVRPGARLFPAPTPAVGEHAVTPRPPGI